MATATATLVHVPSKTSKVNKLRRIDPRRPMKNSLALSETRFLEPKAETWFLKLKFYKSLNDGPGSQVGPPGLDGLLLQKRQGEGRERMRTALQCLNDVKAQTARYHATRLTRFEAEGGLGHLVDGQAASRKPAEVAAIDPRRLIE
jgi:hypothetical protein